MELLEFFGSPEKIYFADETAYASAGELKKTAVSSLMDKSLKESEHILRVCDNKNISILLYSDDLYPQRLKAIPDPPLVLYYQGIFPDVDHLATVGMVGTRKCSGYGMKNGKEIAYQLGKGGAVVVSGIAEGIDTMCLEGALLAGSPIISVLGNGVDVVYPRINRKLYDAVRERGCLISEFIPGTRPFGRNFPVRNRIISGLSLGVVVIEAPERSGARITAEKALNQGRDVFTLPANIDLVTCQGNLQMLKEGAMPITSGVDVLRVYAANFPVNPRKIEANFPVNASSETPRADRYRPKTVSSVDKKSVDNGNSANYIVLEEILPQVSLEGASILYALQNGEKHVDELVEITGLPAAQVSSVMTILQIKNFVVRLPGQRFSLPENIKARERHE